MNGYVYLAVDRRSGLVKIGYSSDPARRTKQLRHPDGRRASIDSISLLRGTRSTERALHKRFRADRVEKEWFRISSRIEAFAAKQKTEMPKPKPRVGHPVMVTFPADLYQKIKRLAEKTDRTAPRMICFMVVKWFENNK